MRTLARPRDVAGVVQRLKRVDQDSRRRWGRMSAHQMLCHLSDSFRLALGEKAAKPAGGLLQRTLVKWTALYAPLPWPAGIRTSPEIDQASVAASRADFATDAAVLEVLLERLVAEGPRLDGRVHPRFGALSAAAWLRWGYLHVDHHLRQFGA
jgi:hypothetical protein